MKQKTTLLILVSLFFSVSAIASEKSKVIAHRGYWKTEGSAQNSIKALELADKIKVYGSEFDVHITADNVPVIFHDDSIQGISIQTSNYKDIKNLKLSNGEKIPTLKQYLKKGKSLKNTKLIFELKPHQTPERNREAARIAVDMVNKMGLKDKTEYITFNMDAGKEIIRLAPDAEVAYLSGNVSPAELKELGYTGLDYHYNVMLKNPNWFKEAKELGMTVNVWTVNQPDIIKQIADLGADYITTDVPEEALEIVSR